MGTYTKWTNGLTPYILVQVFHKQDLQNVEKKLVEEDYVIKRVEESDSFYFLYVEKQEF